MSQRARAVVAVVDDDPRIRESLGELLESAGYEARVYAAGSALLAGDLGSIDCLITDIGMPGIDGFELRRLVKRARPDLPVFLISGRRGASADKQPLERGGSPFFQKPFDGSLLLAAVEAALQSGAP